MKFKVELENGETCSGTLDDEEVAYLQEQIKAMEKYRKKYGRSSKWSITKEIVHGIIPEYIADHKNDR